MFYITISNGLLKDGHRERMGSSVWEFMWFIDHITSIDENGVGKVLGGKPIKSTEIAKDLGCSTRNIRRNIDLLEKEGYINTLRTPYGLVIKIMKAKKIFQKRADKSVPSEGEIGQKRPSIEIGQKLPNKEDNTAIDKTIIYSNASVAGKDIAEIISWFKPVNPFIERYYGNTTQRSSVERMLKSMGRDKLKKVIDFLPISNSKKYSPKITTPYQLETKMGELKAFIDQERAKIKETKKPIFI